MRQVYKPPTINLEESVVIKPLNFQTAIVEIEGTAPYLQHKFSKKAQGMIRDTQLKGQQARGQKTRSPRDFEADYRAAQYIDAENRFGIPASNFRNALIRACSLVGFKMTIAKMSVFLKADTIDAETGTPLVLIRGIPESTEMMARNADGSADIRVRPMWREWSATLTLQWDADQFSATDVINLLARAGVQVGIGEGRPSSPNSNGMGFGTFQVLTTR